MERSEYPLSCVAPLARELANNTEAGSLLQSNFAWRSLKQVFRARNRHESLIVLVDGNLERYEKLVKKRKNI